jgi:ABC-type polysaccharide/polyol phosphate export permease
LLLDLFLYLLPVELLALLWAGFTLAICSLRVTVRDVSATE